MKKDSKRVVVPLSQAKTTSAENDLEQVHRVLFRMLRQRDSISEPFTLVLLEIDDFKGFSKVFGPKRMRRLVEEVASVLRQTLRSGDSVHFVGTNCFALVLEGTNHSAASEVSSRIRVAIKEAAFAPEHGHVLKISISGGFASQGSSSILTSPEDLLEAAASALRVARDSGQDRVIGYSPPTSSLDFSEAEMSD